MAFSSSRRGRRAVIIGGSMSGLFSAAFLRRIGWDVDVFERSPVELVGRGAGITTHPELLEALENERRRHARPRHRGREAHHHRPPGPRHRRAPAAANPHLLGPAAAAAARDHRPGALPPRPHLRARRAGRQRRARPFRRGPGRACRPADRRRRHPLRRARAGRAATCSRSIRAITSGAARRTRPTSRRRRSPASFPISCSSCPSASR